MTNTPEKNFAKKLRLVLPPFLLIQIISLVIVLPLRWALTIGFEVVQLDDTVWLIGSMLFPSLPILIWRRYSSVPFLFVKREKFVSWFGLIAWLSTGVMLLVSQHYLEKNSGEFKTVDAVENIDTENPARFYNIKKTYPDTFAYKAAVDFRTSGKHSQYLDMHLYFVTPLLQHTTRDSSEPQFWYGVKFSEQVNNNLSDAQIDKLYQDFWNACAHVDYYKSFDSVLYFKRSSLSSDHDHFLEAIDSTYPYQSNLHPNIMILTPVYKPHSRDFGVGITIVAAVWLISITFVLIALTFYDFKKKQTKKLQVERDVFEFLEAFIPRGDHVVVSILLNINLLVFICMIFAGLPIMSANGGELVEWGGLRLREVSQSGWWRILASQFVHASLHHLAGNMVCLGIIHVFSKEVISQVKFAQTYLLAGLAGSIAGLIWHPETVSVGASGAIMGLYGYAVALYLVDKKSRAHLSFAIWIIVGTAALTVVIGFFSKSTDNAAHIAGLASGALFAFAGLVVRKKISGRWFAIVAAITVIILVGNFYLDWKKENPGYEFEADRSKEITVTCHKGLSGLNIICTEYFQGYDPASIGETPLKITGYGLQYRLKDYGLTTYEMEIAFANGDSSFLTSDAYAISNQIKVDYCNGEAMPRWLTIYAIDRKPIVSVEYNKVHEFFTRDCPEVIGKIE